MPVQKTPVSTCSAARHTAKGWRPPSIVRSPDVELVLEYHAEAFAANLPKEMTEHGVLLGPTHPAG